MRATRTLVTAVACLALAGCVTVKDGKVVVTDPRAQQVVNAVNVGCSFIPLFETVAALLDKRPGATVTQIKDIICNAVANTTAAQGRRGPLRAPTVAGVKIQGDFNDGRKLR